MVVSCPTYIADESLQLVTGGATGPFDCSAHSGSDAVDHATCGGKDPGGRSIRLLSNEPVPNKSSPGLNLNQIQDVLWDDFGVYLDVRIGGRAALWTEYERRRLEGQGSLIQVLYAPVADSPYDAGGNNFRGNHMMFETLHRTYDPLADGRRAGIYKNTRNVTYTRAMMRHAAGVLDIGNGTPGIGRVWCAFTRDVVPDYLARVNDANTAPDGKFWAYNVVNGRIAYKRLRTTGGFSASCTPPRAYRWENDLEERTSLVRLTSGGRAGMYISSKYSKEV